MSVEVYLYFYNINNTIKAEQNENKMTCFCVICSYRCHFF